MSDRKHYNLDARGNRRVVVLVKCLEDGKHQAQLRQDLGGSAIMFSRRGRNSRDAKREAESLFGPLEWQPAPERLKQSEPGVNQVAYLNLSEAVA